MEHPIVLGCDGSDRAAALDEAVELAHDERHGEIIPVYCHEPPPGLSCQLDPACEAAHELRDCERRVEAEIKPLLQAAEDKIRASGVHGEALMVWDGPATALPRIAGARHSHVIVVGSRCEGALAAAWHHSACYELLHRRDIPVLVVPHRH